jgi:uncharacterized RDD family membrane protein YckC
VSGLAHASGTPVSAPQSDSAPVTGPELDNRRVAAAIVDLAVFGAVIGLLSQLAGGLTTSVMAVGVGWALYYYFALESSAGQTLGKRLLGLRVTGEHGEAPGIERIAMRTVLRLLDGLGLYLVGLVVMLATGQRRQRLGDVVAHTVVTTADSAPTVAAEPAEDALEEEPAEPAPEAFTPVEPAPVEPAAIAPVFVEPAPVEPAPVELAPVELAPQEPAHDQPALEEPPADEPAADEEPASEEPPSEEPAADEELVPEEPAPEEPAPSEAPAQDPPAAPVPLARPPADEPDNPQLDPAAAVPQGEQPVDEQPEDEQPEDEQPEGPVEAPAEAVPVKRMEIVSPIELIMGDVGEDSRPGGADEPVERPDGEQPAV